MTRAAAVLTVGSMQRHILISIVAAAGCAIAAVPAAAKTAPRGINYGGQSSQGDPVVIALAKDRKHVAVISEQFEVKCASGAVIDRLNKSGGRLPISAAGRFSGFHDTVSAVGDGTEIDTTITLKGKVAGSKMTGSFTYDAVIKDAQGKQTDTCGATATFKAAASKSKVYAGFTSQGGPVVAELSANRGRVHHFHIGWQSTCKPEGVLQVGDTLVDFQLRSGVFGGHAAWDVPENTAEHDSWDYTVAGRVTRTKLSGSIEVKAQEFDATGALMTDCGTGKVTFKGATG